MIEISLTCYFDSTISFLIKIKRILKMQRSERNTSILVKSENLLCSLF